MVNYINKEWPCTPEEVQRLNALANPALELTEEIGALVAPYKAQLAWHEGLLRDLGVTGEASVHQLFESVPQLAADPLLPKLADSKPYVPRPLSRRPLNQHESYPLNVAICELPLDPLQTTLEPTRDLEDAERTIRKFDVVAEKVRVVQPLEPCELLSRRPEPGTPLHECEEPFNAPSYWWGVIGSEGLPVGDEPFTHVPDIDLYRKGIARVVGDLGDLTTSNNYDGKRNMNGSNWQGILTLYHQADGYDEPDYPYDEITPPVENVAAARFVIENNDNEAVVGPAAYSRKVIDDLFDTGKTYLDEYIKQGSTTPRRKF